MAILEEMIRFAYWMATNYPEDVNPFTPETFINKKVDDLEWGLHGNSISMMKKRVSQQMSLGLSSSKINLGWTTIMSELADGSQTNSKVIKDLASVATDNRSNS